MLNVVFKDPPPRINPSEIKRVILYKLQVTTNQLDNNFKDLCTMITWSCTLKVKYENLIVLAEIARVQRINTTTCARTFSMHNYIRQIVGIRY